MLTLEEVRKVNWYKQGGAGIPLTLSSPFYSMSGRMHAKSDFYFPNDLAFSFRGESGFLFFHFFDRDLAVREGRKILEKAISDPEFFKSLEIDFQRAGQRVDRIVADFIAEEFSLDKLQSDYESFWSETCKFWESSLFVDLLDPCESEIAEFVFGNRFRSISAKQREALFAPDEQAHFQKERHDMLSIAIRVMKRVSQTERDDMVARHAGQYHWIQNDLEHAALLDPEFFRTDLELLLTDEEAREKIRKSVERFDSALREKKQIEHELSLSDEELRRLRFVRWLSSYRDNRKKYNQISILAFAKIIERIHSISGIEPDTLKFLAPEEIPAMLRGGYDIVEELRKREESGVMYCIYKDRRFDIVSGSVVRKYFDTIENAFSHAGEIQGGVASRGQAKGRVRVIQNRADFTNLEAGDILVTQMTRPEFVPIMEKAAAVVTDEGGVTCHAAIASRELGIPCVIGTQIATKVLKDGDVVEVDADHGVVRRL